MDDTQRTSIWRRKFKVHPAADVFPMMSGEKLAAFVQDIKANGLLEPVEYWGGPVQSLVDDDDGEIGEILDGRNRLEGCERAGEKPRFKAVYTDDPAAYVISKNIHRRHLTKQKQADLIVAAIRADADAKAAAGEIAAAALLGDDGAPRTATHPSYQDCVNRHRISRQHGEKRKKGRKADAVKVKAVVIAKEQGVSKRTVERAFARATPKPKAVNRSERGHTIMKRPVRPKSGPVYSARGIDAARQHYLRHAELAEDLEAEQEIIVDALLEIASTREMRAQSPWTNPTPDIGQLVDDLLLGDIPAGLDRRRRL